MTNNEQDYETCFQVEDVFLPKGGFFGVSAATGIYYKYQFKLYFNIINLFYNNILFRWFG